MFLADSAIVALQFNHHDLIDPFDTNRLDCGAYELTIGNEVLITKEGVQQTKTLLEKDKQQFIIEPGQFALLITEETVHLPKNIIGFISIKSKIKLQGLVNISGFHVDPTFKGKLKFSVYIAGSQPIVLERGQRMFTIWFSRLEGDIHGDYKGASQNQQNLTTEDVKRMQGEVASPNALLKKIEGLERTLELIKYFMSLIVVFIISWFLNLIFIKYKESNNTTTPRTQNTEINKDTNQTTTKPQKKTSDTTQVPTK